MLMFSNRERPRLGRVRRFGADSAEADGRAPALTGMIVTWGFAGSARRFCRRCGAGLSCRSETSPSPPGSSTRRGWLSAESTRFHRWRVAYSVRCTRTEVAVIGTSDPRWGEGVCAVVVPEPGVSVDLEGLREFAAGRIGRYKLPRRLEVVDALPRNATGKVLKTELRNRFGWLAPGLPGADGRAHSCEPPLLGPGLAGAPAPSPVSIRARPGASAGFRLTPASAPPAGLPHRPSSRVLDRGPTLESSGWAGIEPQCTAVAAQVAARRERRPSRVSASGRARPAGRTPT
jgi:hypothetical protein